jgi:hypothetical protein
MPTRQLYISGSSGSVSIVNYDNRVNARNSPTTNLADVYFHTSLPYLQLKETITTTVNLPVVPRSYMEVPEGGGGGCGGCFITEACIKAKSLSDNCDELQTLRFFRDTYMLKDRNMLQLVVEYYEKAPELVYKLNCLSNSLEIYDIIYNTYIVPSVQYIKSKKYSDAFNMYIKGIEYAQTVVTNQGK